MTIQSTTKLTAASTKITIMMAPIRRQPWNCLFFLDMRIELRFLGQNRLRWYWRAREESNPRPHGS